MSLDDELLPELVRVALRQQLHLTGEPHSFEARLSQAIERENLVTPHPKPGRNNRTNRGATFSSDSRYQSRFQPDPSTGM